MSDPNRKPSAEEDTIALNLAQFAPGRKPAESPPSEEGMTMIVERAAAEVAQKNASGGAGGPAPAKEMLGAVAYSYAKGVYRSEDIARKMETNPEYSEAAGDRLPDANAIRRFRRLNRDFIMETLSRVFRRQRKKATAETLKQTLPGAEPSTTLAGSGKPDGEPGETTMLSRKEAEDKLNKAAFIDNMSKDD